MNLRELARYFLAQWSRQKQCPGCGQPFLCGATLRGCWCSEIKLTDAARAEVRKRYSGCLCRTCLERFAKLHEAHER